MASSASSSSYLSDSGNNTPNEIKTPMKRRRKSRFDGLNRRRARYHFKKAFEQKYKNVAGGSMALNPIHVVKSVVTVIDQEPHHYLSDSELSSATTLSDCSTDMSESESCSAFVTSDDNSIDCSVDPQDPQDKANYSTPLYVGSTHTQLSIYTMILLFVIKHSLTSQAFSDLIALINSVLPKHSLTAGSVYKIKEVLQECVNFRPANINYACEQCQMPLESRQSPCTRCDILNPIEYHNLHLEEQLKDLFTDEQFCRMVTAEREFAGPGKWKDIIDGSEYSRVMPKGKPSDEIHISFTLNTDGVAVFSSSKKGNLWPVYLAINELPITLRFSRKYLLPCHLYCHTEKPNMLVYLADLVQSLKNLEHGIEIQTGFGRAVVKGYLLAVTVDLPARAMVANMKQFNGRYGCNVCFAEGASPEGLPMLRYYPFDDMCEQRTGSSMREDGNTAARTGNAVRGIKGSSALAALNYVDLSTAFPIDWMHAVLLGVTKALMNLWLNKEHRATDHYIGDKVAFLDHRLLKIQVPDFVARRPRSLEDHSHWKASECREWLIHFSVPVLKGVLKSSMLTHYGLLVSSVSLLTQELVTEVDITAAEEMLCDFCCLFPSIYGVRKQSMNLHLLTHLSQCVRLYGPLFTFSCFGFESMNAHLKSMIHGTGHINNQVSFAVGMTKALPSLVQKIVLGAANDNVLKKLASKLSSKFTRDESILGNVGFESLGKEKQLPQDHEDSTIIQNVFHQEASSIYQFFRLKYKTATIHSREYGKDSTKNSYSVKFSRGQGDEFALISYYLKVEHVLYAVLAIYSHNQDVMSVDDGRYTILTKYRERPLCQHIHSFSKISTKEVVKLSDIRVLKKCVFMEMENQIYFACPPNLYEHD